MATVFFLGLLLFLGRPRSKRLCPSLLLRQNIEACHTLLQNLSGYLICLLTFMYLCNYPFPCIVTTWQLSTLPLIRFFMRELNISTLIATIPETSFWKVSCEQPMLLLRMQLADLFTKPLSEAQHYLASRLGLMDVPPTPP